MNTIGLHMVIKSVDSKKIQFITRLYHLHDILLTEQLLNLIGILSGSTTGFEQRGNLPSKLERNVE